MEKRELVKHSALCEVLSDRVCVSVAEIQGTGSTRAFIIRLGVQPIIIPERCEQYRSLEGDRESRESLEKKFTIGKKSYINI